MREDIHLHRLFSFSHFLQETRVFATDSVQSKTCTLRRKEEIDIPSFCIPMDE